MKDGKKIKRDANVGTRRKTSALVQYTSRHATPLLLHLSLKPCRICIHGEPFHRQGSMSILAILTNVEPLNIFLQNQVRERARAAPETYFLATPPNPQYPDLQEKNEIRLLH